MLSKYYQRKSEVMAAHAAAAAAMYFCRGKYQKRGSRYGVCARKRERRSVRSIYECLGDIYFRRAYRMSYHSFCKLHEQLKDGIGVAHQQHLAKMKRQRRKRNIGGRGRGRGSTINNKPPIPNGHICSSVRLASALRYFCGGSPCDIMAKYGLSHTETMYSVWYVVESTNKLAEWYITYPGDKDIQKRIAAEFKEKSSVDFDVWAGAIDGLLIWINKPSRNEAKAVKIDQQKFYCGRKHKFGLNCQAVCDVRGRFLDISITYGGATSDLLAFEDSALYKRLQDGVLAEGLVLFGDNAYLNSSFMATPYPNTTGGPKDNYNFYHSQLRIRIECAFGMLVQRWGILRMAMPIGISIKKTIALVNALAKLHNFCIDEVDGNSTTINESLAEDVVNMEMNGSGYVPMLPNAEIRNVMEVEVNTPNDLMGGGQHFDDVPRENRRNRDEKRLPRTQLCNWVASKHAVRPSANRRD